MQTVRFVTVAKKIFLLQINDLDSTLNGLSNFRVSCKLCVMASNNNNNSSKQHICRHTPRHSKPDIKSHLEENERLAELSPKSLVKLKREAYFPKFCARHRRPTEGSEASNLLSELASTRSRRRSPSGRSQFSVNSAGSKFERRSLNCFAKVKAYH